VAELEPIELIPEVTKVDGAIVAELIAARQQLRQQTARIRDLEEALEETVTRLDDALSSRDGQAYLEVHLANIEDTANVQQQAILQLKQQLSEQHYQLRQKDMAFNQLLQSRRSAEQRDQEMLEAELAQHQQTQALLQQACHELELERETQQQRIIELEQQTANLKEQILSQAQQAREYQTAVQHLKDRYLYVQGQIHELHQFIESSDVELPPEIIAIVQHLCDPDGSEQRGIRPYQDLSVNLPSFLKRWQNKDESPP
jgi:chromosome segregation ATPase